MITTFNTFEHLDKMTKLQPSQIKKINDFIKLHYSNRINLGQSNDQKKIRTIHYNYINIDNYEIGIRFCSPSHIDDKSAIYWFVTIYENPTKILDIALDYLDTKNIIDYTDEDKKLQKLVNKYHNLYGQKELELQLKTMNLID